MIIDQTGTDIEAVADLQSYYGRRFAARTVVLMFIRLCTTDWQFSVNYEFCTICFFLKFISKQCRNVYTPLKYPYAFYGPISYRPRAPFRASQFLEIFRNTEIKK